MTRHAPGQAMVSDDVIGNPGTSALAPLSRVHTLSLCGHLQEQLDAMHRKFECLQHEFKRVDSSVTTFSGTFDQHTALIQALQGQGTASGAAMDNLRNSLGHLDAKMQRVIMAHDTHHETIAGLRDGQATSNTTVTKIIQDLSHMAQAFNSLQDTLAKNTNNDVDMLRADVQKMKLLLDRSAQDSRVLHAAVSAHDEEMKSSKGTVCMNREATARHGQYIQELQQRLGETMGGLKKTRDALDKDTRESAMVREEVRGTKICLSDTDGRLKKLSGQVGRLEMSLENAIQDLAKTRSQLHLVSSVSDSTSCGLQATAATVGHLAQSHDVANQNHHALAQQMIDTAAVANHTRRALKITNALVLPDVNSDTRGHLSARDPMIPKQGVAKKMDPLLHRLTFKDT